MVELVNAADSKSAGGNTLRVQVSLPVPERTGLWHTTDPSFFSGQPRFPSPAKKKRTFPVRCCPWLPHLPACRCCLRHPRNIRPCGTARHAGPPVRQKAGSMTPGLFSFVFSHSSMRHDSPRAPVCVPPPDGTRARSPCFALPAASRASPGQSTREDTRARPRRIS